MQHLEFIDWVRNKSKVVIIKDKRSNKKFNLERWIVIDDHGVQKEIIKKIEILEENEDNPTLNVLDYCTVPNAITDTQKEIYMYETFGRKVLGRAGVRLDQNDTLARLKKIDAEKKKKILIMLEDKSLLLYKKLLLLKYRCIFMPSMRYYNQWRRISEPIKQEVNYLIKNYRIDEEE